MAATAGSRGKAVTRPAARRLAVGTCVLTLILIAGTIVVNNLNGGDLYDVNFAIVGVSSAIVGGVVAARRPANRVGWLFLGGALAGGYAVYGIVTDPGAVPLPHAMAWLSSTTFAIGPVIAFILIPLYFPDGRLV